MLGFFRYFLCLPELIEELGSLGSLVTLFRELGCLSYNS